MLSCWCLQPVVRCLCTSGWFTDVVVSSWIQSLAANVLLGCCRNKKMKVSFLPPITQHIFQIRVLTSVVLCGQKKTTEFCNSTSSFSVFFPVWLFLSACFCSLHPHLGVLHLGQNVLELEKLILGSLKCSCKQALMDETAKIISFTSLCCQSWETQLFVLQVLGAHLRFRWQMLSDVWHLDVSDN